MHGCAQKSLACLLGLALIGHVRIAAADGTPVFFECKPADTTWAGHYVGPHVPMPDHPTQPGLPLPPQKQHPSQGSGPSLYLRGDGSFVYLQDYRGNISAKGCWQHIGKQVVLDARQGLDMSSINLMPGPTILDSGGQSEPLPLTNDQFGAKGDSAVFELKMIPGPSAGASLQGMSFWVEFADGSRQQQQIDHEGHARFHLVAAQKIKRYGPGLPAAAAPLRWFDNSESARRWFAIYIDSYASNEKSMATPFRRLALDIQGPGRLHAKLGPAAGPYIRRVESD